MAILVLKKCKKFDDVLFINASEHYGKKKRQNELRQQDIDKILDTYRYRREEERYARRVSLEEIRENGYNLNITRYVSTDEAEEQIDLAAVHQSLAEIEGRIEEATRRHNEFLKELSLAPLR